ncbi:hypothetical protein ABZV15_40105 [Streptomyces sp. NPDC005246]|uniref:hypothetical protein n=1 Tax=unclassified Streptomyces TaxID=2593676 RepID=UPI0033BC726A
MDAPLSARMARHWSMLVSWNSSTMTNDQHRRREKLKNKLREIELVREHEEIRESRSLRRTCYAELNRDARQFNTALN